MDNYQQAELFTADDIKESIVVGCDDSSFVQQIFNAILSGFYYLQRTLKKHCGFILNNLPLQGYIVAQSASVFFILGMMLTFFLLSSNRDVSIHNEYKVSTNFLFYFSLINILLLCIPGVGSQHIEAVETTFFTAVYSISVFIFILSCFIMFTGDSELFKEENVGFLLKFFFCIDVTVLFLSIFYSSYWQFPFILITTFIIYQLKKIFEKQVNWEKVYNPKY